MGISTLTRVVVVAMFIGLAACSGEQSTSWTVSDETSAVFVRWTDSDGVLSGQMQVSRLEGTTVTSDSHGFSGALSEGGQVTINIPQWLGPARSLTGTLEGNELVLSFPDGEGGLSNVRFSPAGVADFNDAVAALNVSAEEAQAEADAQTAREQAERQHQARVRASERAAEEAQRDLERAEQKLRDAEERLTDSLEAEIKELEAVVASGDDYAREVEAPYLLNASIAYEVDAIIWDLDTTRTYIDEAATSGVAAASVTRLVDELRSEVNDLEWQAEQRWQHAVRVAQPFGVQPDGRTTRQSGDEI